MTMPEEITICQDALDYIWNVTEKQGRVLDFETMYAGYKATIGEELTEYGFKMVFNSFIEALIEQDIKEKELK